MSGKKSRDKGGRREREVVALFEKRGYTAYKIPLSGASRGFPGDVLIKPEFAAGIDPLGLESLTDEKYDESLLVQVKSLKNGWKTLYKQLEGHDVLMLKADNEPWLMVRVVK